MSRLVQMKLCVLFVMWVVCDSVAQRVPAREWVTAEMIAASRLDMRNEDTSTLLGKYIRSLKLKLQSLSSVFTSGDSFHTDALFFSLLDTPLNIARLESSINNRTSTDPHIFEFTEYEILLKSVAIPGRPGIHERLKNASLLSSLSEAYIRNYEIVYVADVLDSSTYDRVCSRFSRLYISVLRF